MIHDGKSLAQKSTKQVVDLAHILGDIAGNEFESGLWVAVNKARVRQWKWTVGQASAIDRQRPHTLLNALQVEPARHTQNTPLYLCSWTTLPIICKMPRIMDNSFFHWLEFIIIMVRWKHGSRIEDPKWRRNRKETFSGREERFFPGFLVWGRW